MAVTGYEIWPLLKALGAPDRCTEFHLIAKVDAAVIVQATFFAPDYEFYEIWTFGLGKYGEPGIRKEVKPKIISERYYLTKIDDACSEDMSNGQQS